MIDKLKKGGMMMGVTAGPFIAGLIIGVIVGALLIYFLFQGATWLCPTA